MAVGVANRPAERAMPCPALALLLVAAPPRPMVDLLGATHMAGKYCLTEQDYLNEGADQLLALGMRVIKLNLSPGPYPWHSDWPAAGTPLENVQTPYFRALLAKPFRTVHLWSYAHGVGGWRNGLSDEDAAEEERQQYELTRYLLTEYRDSGKTFVLSHWEGDWSIRGHTDAQRDPTDEAIAGMAAWLRARQAGVDRARAEVGQQGVQVYHAAEVNLVVRSLREGAPNVVNRVLPQVEVDLVSYSAYDGQGDAGLLRECLDFIAAHARTTAPFERDVFIGEFGLPENEFEPERRERVIRGVVETARDWGCPWILYWQLYCNEARRQPVERNEDCRGFWLLRPDGTRAFPCDWFVELLAGG